MPLAPFTLICLVSLAAACSRTAAAGTSVRGRWSLEITYLNSGLDCTASGSLTLQQPASQTAQSIQSGDSVTGSYSVHSACENDQTGFDEFGPLRGSLNGDRINLTADGARTGGPGWVYDRMWAQCVLSGVHSRAPEVRLKGAFSCNVPTRSGRSFVAEGTFDALPHAQ